MILQPKSDNLPMQQLIPASPMKNNQKTENMTPKNG